MKFAALILLACCALHPVLMGQTPKQGDHSPTALWRSLKRALSGPRGREYFEEGVKSVRLPALYGTIVSGTPADHPNEFLVAMADNTNPEVTLKLKHPLKKPLPAGKRVKFEGLATAFTAEPFMLTFQVEVLK